LSGMVAPTGRSNDRERSMSASNLVREWRHRAVILRQLGGSLVEPSAELWEQAASELEKTLAARDAELLSLRQAAEESGYSEDHLGRLVRDGGLENHGKKHAPKVRRGSLPKKPVRAGASRERQRAPSRTEPSLKDLVRASKFGGRHG
jgi:hypothetical protein